MDERTAEVVAEARAIFIAIEEHSVPVSRVALRARRLAELIDDNANFMWLRLECEGALDGVPLEKEVKNHEAAIRGIEKFMKLRAAVDYATVSVEKLAQVVSQGKVPERTRVMAQPLALLETEPVRPSKEERALIANEPGGADALAMIALMDHGRETAIERVAAAIHAWASNVYITHKFRQIAGNIFERFKTRADATLSTLCPEAIGKLTHAVERASSEKAEDWSAAALASRRVLKEFADAVYPPRAEKVDGHVVDDLHYKNRLWAFAKERGRRALEQQFLAFEEVEGLCAALDKVNEHDAKGVHASITRDEAEMLVLRTYILLAQLSQLVKPEE